jgi:hypothetical protein
MKRRVLILPIGYLATTGIYLCVRRRSKDVATPLHAARRLLRRGVKNIILEALYLSVWDTLSKSVDNRCGGAKSCLSGDHAWLSVSESSNQTRRPTLCSEQFQGLLSRARASPWPCFYCPTWTSPCRSSMSPRLHVTTSTSRASPRLRRTTSRRHHVHVQQPHKGTSARSLGSVYMLCAAVWCCELCQPLFTPVMDALQI